MPLEQRDRTAVLCQPPADGVGGQPVVERAFEHELDEALQVELVRRHAEHDPRLRLGRVAHGAGVADRAIESDLIDPETAAPRDADRQRGPGSNTKPSDA